MKIIMIFTLIFASIICKSQKSFSTEYEARYTLDYKLIKSEKESRLTTFILLMNNKESYFKSMNVYVGDSLMYYKKIKENENSLNNLKYTSEYPENIGTTLGKIYVTSPISEGFAAYEESNNINWKLVNEFKTIGNAKCQKAITTKYGRSWIAYFNPKIPLNFGPYKFNKLPGLIVELYDDKDEFHYKLYKFKKRKGLCSFANSYKLKKPVKKEKVYMWRKNMILDMSAYKSIVKEDPETLRESERKLRKLYDDYNTIELSPN